MAPIRVDDDLLPTSVFAVSLTRLNQPSGWLVGELNLEEMWRVVDSIRIGQRGFALVAAPDGALVAHGDPDKKALVAQAANISSHPLLGEPGPNRRGRSSPDESGTRAPRGGAKNRAARLDADRRAADERSLRERAAPAAAGCSSPSPPR